MKGRFFLIIITPLLCSLAVHADPQHADANFQELAAKEIANNYKDAKSLNDLPEDKKQEVLGNLETYFSQEFEAPKDSREIKRLIAGLQGKSLPDEEEKAFTEAEPQRVLTYYRFGKGTALPSEQSLQKVANSIGAKNASLQKKVVSKLGPDGFSGVINNASNQALDMGLVPLALKACPGDTTITREIEQGALTQQVAKDFLIVGDNIPVDPKTAFGKDTAFYVYTTTVGDAYSTFFGKMGVPCLPFRVRLVGNTIKYSTGSEALKNFDADPQGEGILDATVQAYLQRQPGGAQ